MENEVVSEIESRGYLMKHTNNYEMKDKVGEVITCIRERGEKKETYKNSVIFDYLEDCIAERYLNLYEKEEMQQKQLNAVKKTVIKSIIRGIFTGFRQF